MNRKKTIVLDLCLIASLLITALLLFAVQRSEKNEGKWAVVRVDGKQTGRYPLSEDISVSVNGGSNTIVIKDGGVSIIYADCPDKLCVKQGTIMYSGQCITCLPNKLTVTVEGGDSPVDAVI